MTVTLIPSLEDTPLNPLRIYEDPYSLSFSDEQGLVTEGRTYKETLFTSEEEDPNPLVTKGGLSP